MLNRLNSFGQRWGRVLAAVIISLVMSDFGLLLTGTARADVTLGGPQDCDANAVIYCGATTATQLVNKYINGDGHNSVASIQNIFAYFGITSAMVQTMPTTAQAGSVDSSGNVFVGSQKVATNALTGGRQNIAGSTQVTFQGTTFYTRPPSVSFASSPLPAFVVMNGNTFEFAVLSSCGNAVKATAVTQPTPTPTPTPSPTPTTPNYTIQKLVAPHGSTNFQPEIQVNPNTNVDYQVVIKSTGTAAVQNLVVKDTLPSDDTYVTGTLARDGNNIDAHSSQFFGGGITIDSLPAGNSTAFTFEALAGAKQNNSNCNPETLPNVANMSATSLPAESSTATVSVECVPAPAKTAVLTTVTTPTKPSPPAPTQLVNTGPGEVVGLFTGASIAGGLGYRLYLGRKLTAKP